MVDNCLWLKSALMDAAYSFSRFSSFRARWRPPWRQATEGDRRRQKPTEGGKICANLRVRSGRSALEAKTGVSVKIRLSTFALSASFVTSSFANACSILALARLCAHIYMALQPLHNNTYASRRILKERGIYAAFALEDTRRY